MDTPPLTIKQGVLLVCIYNMTDGTCKPDPEKVSFHQSLPVTGDELLAIACEKFNYKGTSARLVKTVYTRDTKTPRERGAPLRRSFEFDKEFYRHTSICLLLVNVGLRPHKNLKAIERKTRQSVKMASDTEESEDYDELPERVELPFYNPSRKRGLMVGVLVDPIEALED